MAKRTIMSSGGSCVITIPPYILEELNMKKGDDVLVTKSGNSVKIVKKED